MDPWADWIRAACLPAHCNCEAVRQGWIAQPSAFWSSLAYFASWAILSFKLWQKNIALKIWLFTFLFLGGASHFAPGSMTEVAMACDFAAICLLLLAPGLLRLLEKKLPDSILFILVPLLFTLVTLGFYGAEKLTKIGLALVTFVFSIADHLIHESKRIRDPGFGKAVTILVASFLFFIWDESKIQCEPNSWLQGHTLWHLGSAWAIYEYTQWRFGPTLS